MNMKKVKNIEWRGNNWWFRYKLNGNCKYINTQLDATATYIQRLTRRNDITDLIPAVKSGEISMDELKAELRWYKRKGDTITMTIQYYIDEYMEYKTAKDRTTTVKRNHDSIIAIQKSLMGTKIVDGIEVPIPLNQHISDFNLELIEKFIKRRRFKASVSTVNIDLRFLSSFANWMLDHQYISHKLKISALKSPKLPPKHISEDNFIRLINEESIPSWVRDAAKIYWFTGCRKMELINGKLRGMNLVVAAGNSKGNDEFNIPLEKWMLPIVKVVHQKKDEHLANGYKLYTFDAISTEIIKGFKAIGIYDKYRTKLHSLRHSFGCRMYMITTDITQVQIMMNHASDKSTKGYVHLKKDDLLNDFPTTAKNSRFLDNMERVNQDQSDILEYLDVA